MKTHQSQFPSGSLSKVVAQRFKRHANGVQWWTDLLSASRMSAAMKASSDCVMSCAEGFAFTFIYPSIYLSIDRSIYLSINRSFYLFICLSIYLSIYLNINTYMSSGLWFRVEGWVSENRKRGSATKASSDCVMSCFMVCGLRFGV